MKKSLVQYTARIVSIVGHPLLTISILVYFLSHRELPEKEANLVSAVILGGVTLPIVLHNVWKMSKGQYANFDVSDQKQRKSFFPFALALLAIVTFYFWWTEKSAALVYSTALFLLMVSIFAVVNIRLKISLHAGVNFYIAAILFHYSAAWGTAVLCLAILVAVSRWILKRHTFWEIVLGTVVGIVFGCINTIFL